MIIYIIATDGGSNSDNYVTLNGERILTAVWGVSNFFTCSGAAVVDVNAGDLIEYKYKTIRSNGWATSAFCCYLILL